MDLINRIHITIDKQKCTLSDEYQRDVYFKSNESGECFVINEKIDWSNQLGLTSFDFRFSSSIWNINKHFVAILN